MSAGAWFIMCSIFTLAAVAGVSRAWEWLKGKG